ncbi:MAG: AMP-binding protein, partial [Terriglobales bacterium]
MNPPATLLDLLQLAPGNRTAIIVPELNLRITYDALRQQVLAMADILAVGGAHGRRRVATVLPNGLPALVTFLAGAIAGTAAPLNPAYPYEEFFFFLGDTGADVLLCPPHGAEQARSAAADR